MKDRLFALVRTDPWRMNALTAARDLGLPDGWIGAGFVRALVWDHLSGRATPTRLDDVDVIYFDPANMDEATEKAHNEKLKLLLPSVPWSCKNQARMHLKFGAGNPYKDTEDGLRHWLETPTAVALRLDGEGNFHLLAPFGLTDLFAMRIAPTPYARLNRPDQYRGRVLSKPWRSQWPKLEIILP
jgi:hypothetical protein